MSEPEVRTRVCRTENGRPLPGPPVLRSVPPSTVVGSRRSRSLAHGRGRGLGDGPSGPSPPGRPRRWYGSQVAASAAVGAGDDFEEVVVGAGEVDAAAAVAVIDLPGLVLGGIGPEVGAGAGDPSEDVVELGFAHQEGVVLERELTVVAIGVEVEVDTVRRPDLPEGPEARGLGQAEQRGEPVSGALSVSGRDDRVVQLDRHAASLPDGPRRSLTGVPRAIPAATRSKCR